MSSLKLDWCGADAARYATERWHYSRSLQAGKSAKIGVWEDSVFIGVVVFSAGSGSTTKWARNVGLERVEMAELARVALGKHKAPVTKIVAIAIRLLHQQSPGIKLIVSYADPRMGHHGGIYQGGNWVYIGQTNPDTHWVDKFGVEHHPRMVSPSGTNITFGTLKRITKKGDCRPVTVPGKHKYLFALDADTKIKIEKFRKPYPKRVGSETADTATVQVEKGGLEPTPTLQSQR